MQLSSIKTSVTETLVEQKDFTVVVTQWGNYEGANLMVHGHDLSLRMAGSFRWGELDAIVAAISIARTSEPDK